ncbi:MAG: hypothetical protein U0325_31585, partial [Polyangiales bacterium]
MRRTTILLPLLLGCAGGEPASTQNPTPDASAVDDLAPLDAPVADVASVSDAATDRTVARDQTVVTDRGALDVVARDAGADVPVDIAVRDVPISACESMPAVPTFPGAEGFGSVAKGGRCGQVVHVTTLDPTGPGSLQAALDVRGPRTIVFDVSGVINGQVAVTYGRVTIAGQTSPGGVIVRGIKINEEAFERGGDNDDIVIRHIRTRPDGAGLDDALRINHAQHVMVDHVSAGRASDECVEISYSHDVTVQNTILAETIGDHAEYGGMLVNYSDPPRYPLDNLSIHHNL